MKSPTRDSFLICAVLIALIFPAAASAQSLSVGSGSGFPGNVVDLTVNFTAGAIGVSTLQFDLAFSSSLTYTSVATGAAALAAGKSASGAIIPGGVRILVFGLNQGTMGTGAVAAVRLTISGGAAPGPVPVSIGNVIASDPIGDRVSSSGSGGTVTVAASADTTPPVISAVSATSITSGGATISWATNETSSSQVEYGPTAAYGSVTTVNVSLVTTHSQALSGLLPSTLYHYRVKSTDGSGNISASSDYTLTTAAAVDTTPPVISGVTATGVTSTGASLLWATNENADSQAEYGTTAAYGSSTGLNTVLSTSHTQVLSGLSPSTLYHYRVKSRDASGNLATSPDSTFTTSAPPDTTPPQISAVTASAVTAGGATITWATDEYSDSQVEYGTSGFGSSTGLNSTMTLGHAQTLSGLSASTTYHYRVKSRDAAGNLATSPEFTFTTTSNADTTPPVISAVSAAGVTAGGAAISWTTDEESDSVVEYGSTESYGGTTALNPAMVTAHAQSLSGLSPSTLYHYRVKSRDAAGNLATSPDHTFTTAASTDSTPPVISRVSAGAVTATAAAISWATDEDADSQAEYGITAAYGNATAVNAAMTTSHTQSLSGLFPSTLYHYRVKSRDAAGNPAVSTDFTFTTSSSDTTAPVITGVTATGITRTTALILWSTDKDADSTVEYGPTSSYGESVTNPAAVKSHSQLLSGLTAGTQYHYRVKSRDGSGNLATSEDRTFATLNTEDTTPPVISAVTVYGINSSRATVSWSTNESADSQVEFGFTESYGRVTDLRATLSESHYEALTGLESKRTYHFRVKSKDADGNLAVSGDFTFTTTDKADTANTLFYPFIPGGPDSQPGGADEQYVGLAIANLDNRPATLMFTAYGLTGEEIAGPSIINPAIRVLNPSQQLPVVDTQLFGDAIQSNGSAGWIKIESNVEKVAGFFLMFNSNVTVLDGANLSSHPMASFILPEVEDRGFTRVDIANPNAEAMDLNFELVRGNGTTAASASRTVGSNGAVVADLFTDIFTGVNPSSSDYVRITSPKGLLAFEWLGVPSQYTEGLNGQDSTAGGTTIYSPQYAVGGSWRSALSVVNLDDEAGTVTFRFIRDGANMAGATKALPIEPHGKILIDDPAFFQGLFVNPTDIVTEGYVEISSSGVRLTGSVVFGDPERNRFSAALPLVQRLQNSILFSQIASNETYFTGLAIVNPNSTDVTATIDLYSADGHLEASTVKSIAGRQRKSMVLTEYFPTLIGQERSSGYVKITADKEVAAFALFGTNDLSVLSAVPPQDIP